jgi:hypothetical protein
MENFAVGRFNKRWVIRMLTRFSRTPGAVSPTDRWPYAMGAVGMAVYYG